MNRVVRNSELFAVVADSLNGAGLEGFVAESRFGVVGGLLFNACAAFVGEFKETLGCRSAETAAYALRVYVEFSGDVELIFFVFVCHNAFR